MVFTWSEVSGPPSGLGEGGGTIALMVALMSCHVALPEHAPLSSYRSGQQVRAWGYGQALKAPREVVCKSGCKPQEYVLHSLRIGSASTLADGGDVSERVIQREGKWKSDAYNVYTGNDAENAGKVSRKLAAGKGMQIQPGQDTVWSNQQNSRRRTWRSGMVLCHFGVSVVRKCVQ